MQRAPPLTRRELLAAALGVGGGRRTRTCSARWLHAARRQTEPRLVATCSGSSAGACSSTAWRSTGVLSPDASDWPPTARARAGARHGLASRSAPRRHAPGAAAQRATPTSCWPRADQRQPDQLRCQHDASGSAPPRGVLEGAYYAAMLRAPNARSSSSSPSGTSRTRCRTSTTNTRRLTCCSAWRRRPKARTTARCRSSTGRASMRLATEILASEAQHEAVLGELRRGKDFSRAAPYAFVEGTG